MFLITMVFLAGLIFTVQQLLFQYTFLDLSSPMQKSDFYLLTSISNSFNDSIWLAPNCNAASKYIQELATWLSRQTFRTYTIDLKYNGKPEPNIICANWFNKPPNSSLLTLSINMIGPVTETSASFELYSRFEPVPQE